MNNLLLNITQPQGITNAAVAGVKDNSHVSNLLGIQTDDLPIQTFPDALHTLLNDAMPAEKQNLNDLEVFVNPSFNLQEMNLPQEIKTALSITSGDNTNYMQPIQLEGEIKAVNPEIVDLQIIEGLAVQNLETNSNPKLNVYQFVAYVNGESKKLKLFLPQLDVQNDGNQQIQGYLLSDDTSDTSDLKTSALLNNNKLGNILPTGESSAQQSIGKTDLELTTKETKIAHQLNTNINQQEAVPLKGETRTIRDVVPQNTKVPNYNTKQQVQENLVSNDYVKINLNTIASPENNKHETILPVQVSIKQDSIINSDVDYNIEDSKLNLQATFQDTAEGKKQVTSGNLKENIKATVTIDQKTTIDQLNNNLQLKPETSAAELKNIPASNELITKNQKIEIGNLNKNSLNQDQQLNRNNEESKDSVIPRQVNQNNTTTNDLLKNNEQNIGFKINNNFRQEFKLDTKINQFNDLLENNINIKSELIKDVNTQKITPQQILESPKVEDFNWDKFKINFNRINYNQLRDIGEVRLNLHPAHLGKLKVNLISNAEEVIARFELSTESSRQMVENNLPQLRESLEKAGIKIDTMEVVVGDNHQKNHRHSHYNKQEKKFKNLKSGNNKINQIKTILNSAQFVGGAVGLNVLA